MGGKNFFKIHTCATNKHCSDMIAKKYGIDVAIWLYQIMIGIRKKARDINNIEESIHDYIDTQSILRLKQLSLYDIVHKYEEPVKHVIAICSLIELVMERQFFPLCVFDGKAPKLKKRKMQQRRDKRDNASISRDQVSEIYSDEYNKYNKRCVVLRENDCYDIKEILSACGLPYVQSNGEAELQLAAIIRACDNISGIITEDSDALIFGANNIVKGFTRKNSNISIVNLQDILSSSKHRINNIRNVHSLLPIADFTEENLIDLTIINGTDYNDPIIDIGKEELEQDNNINNKLNYELLPDFLFEIFAVCDMNIEKIVEHLKLNHNITVSDEYIITCKNVREYYINADVIDPLTLDMSIKKPNYHLMYKLLVEKFCFKKIIVDRMYNNLIKMYYLNNNIEYGNDCYKSFRSYQMKFYNFKHNLRSRMTY